MCGLCFFFDFSELLSTWCHPLEVLGLKDTTLFPRKGDSVAKVTTVDPEKVAGLTE